MNRKTKIVCTIGPRTCTNEAIQALVDSGMNIARLNGSHNNLDWHRHTIQTIREVAPQIPILFDIPGKKIRTKTLEQPFVFLNKDVLIFTTSDSDSLNKIPVNYPYLHKDLKVGDTVLIDDGQYKFEVKEISGMDIHLQALCNGEIRSCKGLNVPYVKINGPVVASRDISLLNFCAENKVDFVGISFVESRLHVQQVKSHLEGSGVEVIAKIENKFGIENLQEILDESYGILIDRGDLSAETDLYQLPLMQKIILKAAREMGKPAIVATEMLHHMISGPLPTKAEVNDIANAVFDGAAAVMLSGETAVGEYYKEAVQTMVRTIQVSENHIFGQDGFFPAVFSGGIPGAVANSIGSLCRDIPITKVISVSLTGFAPRMISRLRLKQNILVATDSIEKARKLNLLWGVSGYPLPISFRPESTEHFNQALSYFYYHNVIDENDLIVLTAVKYPKNNAMNFIEIYEVKVLSEILKWKKENERVSSL